MTISPWVRRASLNEDSSNEAPQLPICRKVLGSEVKPGLSCPNRSRRQRAGITDVGVDVDWDAPPAVGLLCIVLTRSPAISRRARIHPNKKRGPTSGDPFHSTANAKWRAWLSAAGSAHDGCITPWKGRSCGVARVNAAVLLA